MKKYCLLLTLLTSTLLLCGSKTSKPLSQELVVYPQPKKQKPKLTKEPLQAIFILSGAIIHLPYRK